MRPRILILSRQPDSHAARRLLAAGNELSGTTVRIVDPHEFYLYTGGGALSASVSHPELGQDWSSTVLVPRLASLATEYSLAALDALEHAGAASLTSAAALHTIRHKFSALLHLARHGLPVPESAMLHTPNELAPAAERLGGYPLMVKFIRGSQGVGVVRAPDAATAVSILEALNLVQYDVMLQRYYPAAGGADLRVLVLGGQARWAIRRQAEPGSFRSNFHRGGQAEVATTSGAASRLAEQAAALCGLGFAGVDIIESGSGPLVLEVNGSPGFRAVEEAHSTDVASEIIYHCHGLLSN